MFRKISTIVALLMVAHLTLPVFIPPIQGAIPVPYDKRAGTTDRHHIELLQDRKYFETLLEAIRGAKSEIVMVSFMFKTNGYRGNYPDILLNYLIMAAKRGVRIRVLLERGESENSQVDKNNRETAQRLREGGIDVSFDTPRTTTHTKVIVIDRRYTFLGSHNLTASALKYNHELSLLVDSPGLAMEALEYINSLYE